MYVYTFPHLLYKVRLMTRRLGLFFIVLALVLPGVATTAPFVAAAETELTIKLKPVSRLKLKQGVPFKFKIVLNNPSTTGTSAEVLLGLQPADRSSDLVTFDRYVLYVAPGQSRKVDVSVVSSQWFKQKGRFRLSATSGPAIKPIVYEVAPPPVRVPRFRDVTDRVGLSTQHEAEVICDDYSAGAAWADVDGDGDQDLYLPHQERSAQLFINEGGTFVDRADEAGVANGGSEGIAASFADYDNDGDPDLYAVNSGDSRLFRNDGTGAFEDVTAEAGVPATGPSSSAAWGDYDNDGFVDLYVPSWGNCNNPGYVYTTDYLYHNQGDGTFVDRTSLLHETGTTLGAGFQASWFDYDGDRDVDLYLGNDYGGPQPKPNVLWRNDGEREDGSWAFTNVSQTSGMGISINTMGTGLSDYDRDGDIDVALSNIKATRLMNNQGDGSFRDVAEVARVGRPAQQAQQLSITWGLAFYDFNLDGWEDLYVAGGSLGQEGRPEPQRNATFANIGRGKFVDLSTPSGADDPGISRGVAFTDYDGDGRVDLYVVNQGGEPRLYRNVTGKKNRRWLMVDTVGSLSNRDGCGARLIAKLNKNTKMVREVYCGSTSLGSGSDPFVHFGFKGKYLRVLPRLSVRWPSGKTQVRKNVRLNRTIRIKEPS